MGRRRRTCKEDIVRDRTWEPPRELRNRIQAMAIRWSKDDRDVIEDLEQEALLAIWLKGESQAPLNHQVQTAKNRMLSVRKLGKSVDGKLDATYKRPQPYIVLSIQTDGVRIDDEVLIYGDLLPSRHRVEEAVIAKLTFLELLSLLEPRERVCTVLLYMGYSPREIADAANYPPRVVGQLLDGARGKLRSFLREARTR